MSSNSFKLKKLRSNKKPKAKDKNNYVGIEIECYLPIKNIKELKLDLIKHNVDSYCFFDRDGSIDVPQPRKCVTGCYLDCDLCPYAYQDLELCVLVKEKEFTKVIPKICKLLKKHGAEVNSSCGLHVHLDMRHRDKEQSFFNLCRSQDFLFSLVNKDRKYNDSCEYNFKSDFSDSLYEDRYRAINPMAYKEHKTIECRLHEGTLDYDKIIIWIKVLIRIADKEIFPYKIPNSLKGVSKLLKLSKKTTSFLKSRIKSIDSKCSFLKAS